MQNLIYFLSLHWFRADPQLTNIFGVDTLTIKNKACQDAWASAILEWFGNPLLIIDIVFLSMLFSLPLLFGRSGRQLIKCKPQPIILLLIPTYDLKTNQP
jgi:hypothetical protein